MSKYAWNIWKKNQQQHQITTATNNRHYLLFFGGIFDLHCLLAAGEHTDVNVASFTVSVSSCKVSVDSLLKVCSQSIARQCYKQQEKKS